jgi:uncharacterized protein (TIGR02996 family)
MSEHVGFLRELSPDPRGDFNRLVYADWLDEHGHPLAELLRLQVAIARCKRTEAALPGLVERETSVLARHQRAWRDLLAELTPWPDAALRLQADVLELSGRDPLAFRCSGCGGERCWRWGPSNPLMLHWVLNPGLAVNELLLGQRIPREMFTCRACRRTALRCVACRRLQPLEGEMSRGLGVWKGLHCPACGSAIPMLRNLLSGAILGVGKLALLPWRRKRDMGQK